MYFSESSPKPQPLLWEDCCFSIFINLHGISLLWICLASLGSNWILKHICSIYAFLWQVVPQEEYPLQEYPPLICPEPNSPTLTSLKLHIPLKLHGCPKDLSGDGSVPGEPGQMWPYLKGSVVNHTPGRPTGFPAELPEGDSVQLRFALPCGAGCWLKQEHRVIIISTGQEHKFTWEDPGLHVEMHLLV